MANKTREAAGLKWFLSRNGPQLMQKGYNQVILLALLLGGAQCDLYETIFTHATHIQYNKVCSFTCARLRGLEPNGAVRSTACY